MEVVVETDGEGEGEREGEEKEEEIFARERVLGLL